MYALTMGTGMNVTAIDVCLTEAVVVVSVPYPNISETATTEPTADSLLIECMPALNESSVSLVSEGDEAGLLLGVVSHMISGETLYSVGCTTIFADGMPVQRLTSVTGQNALETLENAVGVTSSPSQTTVLTLG
ncbi:DUF4150 domain-containing protein [Celerinatantimonas sp. MCCC 1A17872]|uniref:DUF4150 domain-containing protein n=1 Tax=Celerinatantimonas sp. MCCC 1A17872 TaxID=3177514 RepID=UPI0038C13C86